jgi:hypothetical protein
VVVGLLISHLSGVVRGQNLPAVDNLKGGTAVPGVDGKGKSSVPTLISTQKIYINLLAGGLGETVQGLGIDQILNLDLDNQKVRYSETRTTI